VRKLLPAAAVGLCLATVGCGEKQDVTTASAQDQVNVAVHAPESPATVCIHAAHATGAYAQAGLKVALNALPDAAAPSGQLTSGTALLAVMTPLSLVEQRDGGAPFISVAHLNGEVPLSWGALDTKKVTKKTKALHQRHLQAITGSPKAPAVLAATRDSVDSQGNVLRRFLQATGRACSTTAGYVAGWNEWVAAGGTDGSKKPKKLDPKKVHSGTPASKLAPGAQTHPWGWQSPAEWNALILVMTKSGQLRGAIAPDTVYTNEFLAGEGS
jgi:hypothetical protein